MLEPIFGSLVREQVLLFIHARGSGYAREIARYFGSPVDSVQKQLKRLEEASVLSVERKGRTVLYSFNGSYTFLRELRYLMEGLLGKSEDEYGDSGPGTEREAEAAAGDRVIVREYRRGC